VHANKKELFLHLKCVFFPPYQSAVLFQIYYIILLAKKKNCGKPPGMHCDRPQGIFKALPGVLKITREKEYSFFLTKMESRKCA
jgi:hypothetical protein